MYLEGGVGLVDLVGRMMRTTPKGGQTDQADLVAQFQTVAHDNKNARQKKLLWEQKNPSFLSHSYGSLLAPEAHTPSFSIPLVYTKPELLREHVAGASESQLLRGIQMLVSGSIAQGSFGLA